MAKPPEVLGVAAPPGAAGTECRSTPPGSAACSRGVKGKVCILENNFVVFKYTNLR